MNHSKYETDEQHAGWIYAFFRWNFHLLKSEKNMNSQDFQLPLQRFFLEGQQYLNNQSLKGAFKMFGLLDTTDYCAFYVSQITFLITTGDVFFFYFPGLISSCFNHEDNNCGKQLTGPLYSTPEDYAELFTIIISLYIRLQGSSGLHIPPRYWTKNLNIINPAITPQLMQSLESAAQDFHDDVQFNKELTHDAEVYLLSWLKAMSN
ncbi:hypothetical protein BDQ17DRAFT_1327286 [Cyathus striatus]|nr:hypothetical protein BDQ17DRAFT_1327286 [Cyathus striatus]